MLARLQRRDRHFGVKLVGRGDRDDVDGGIGDQRAPIRRRPGEAELSRAAVRKVVGHFAKQFAANVGRIAEHRLDPGPGQRMALAHITRADEADADRSHEIPPERNILWTKQFGTFILFMATGVKSRRRGNAPAGPS